MNAQKRIRELLDERGWSEYHLAKVSGLAQSTITNMFKRNNAPTLPTLEAICAAMGITLSQFFSDGADPAALTAEQATLISKWSTLTDDQKEALLRLIDTI